MGEAKRRGSYTQRVEEGIVKEQERVRKLEENRRMYIQNLSSADRQKREKAMKILAVACAAGATF